MCATSGPQPRNASRPDDARPGPYVPQQGAAAAAAASASAQARPTRTAANGNGGPVMVWEADWTAEEFLQAVEATLIFMALFFAMFFLGFIF